MIKAVLLDDEPLALRQLELYAAKTPGVEVLASCTSASAAKDCLSKANLLLADINMPDINGLDFVRSLEHPPLVVFTTAYAQYALEGFRVNAVDYLLKPFSLQEFQRAMDKVRHILEVEAAAQSAPSTPEVLHVKSDYKTLSVPLDQIRYIESMSEYVKIWIQGKTTPLLVLYSLKRLVEQLPAKDFLRIHRSYIVALREVKAFAATAVTLQDGNTLPVGESYRPAVRAYLSGI